MRSVSDEKDAIRHAVDEALRQADAVFVTGGLGPTKDDLTKKTLADFFSALHFPNLTMMEAYSAVSFRLPA